MSVADPLEHMITVVTVQAFMHHVFLSPMPGLIIEHFSRQGMGPKQSRGEVEAHNTLTIIILYVCKEQISY